VIDLRSDTVTKPSDAMRRAMAEAEVGDDVYGEDPSVERLQDEAAEVMGFEASLFVPSGTMGNQICLRLLGAPGGPVICDTESHLVTYESDATAALSGLQFRAIPSPDGLPDPDAIAQAVAQAERRRSAVITVENTHNMKGGRVYGRQRLEPVLALAGRLGVPVHLDGARIFNAATALGVPPSSIARGFDSVMFCLSKGLGAPVGSLICGSREFVDEARLLRRTWGAGMRQVGVLAAAGLVALRDGPGRLGEDHRRARQLAAALADQPGIEFDPEGVQSNIVMFRVLPSWFGGEVPAEGASAGYVRRLRERGVLGLEMSADQVRLVSHLDADDAAIDLAIEALRAVAA
jgi:threonine aldolase